MNFDDGDVVGILLVLLVGGLAVLALGFALAFASVRRRPAALLCTAIAALTTGVAGAVIELNVWVVVVAFLAVSAALGFLVGWRLE